MRSVKITGSLEITSLLQPADDVPLDSRQMFVECIHGLIK